jgi:hypothetical protein
MIESGSPYFETIFLESGPESLADILVSSSRRDPAQAALLQVGTPSFGNSHCVTTT